MKASAILSFFWKDTSGQVATILALAIIPLICAVGLGVDYSNLAREKTALQNHVDVLALERREGKWLTDNIYQVQQTKTVQTYFMKVVGYKDVDVSAAAQAYVRPPVYVAEAPAFKGFGGEAGDFNIMGVYCYNTKTHVRSKMIRIVDNRGNSYNDGSQVCDEDEEIYYYLENYKFYEPGDIGFGYQWSPCSTADARCTHNFFFSDPAARSGGSSDGVKSAMTETVLCRTLDECVSLPCTIWEKIECVKRQDSGGPIPSGKKRSATVEKRPCQPGQYMYYAWEDTDASSWGTLSDMDFDDAILVVSCPELKQVPGKSVFLIK